MLEATPESVRAALGFPFDDTPPPELDKVYKQLYLGLTLCVAREPDKNWYKLKQKWTDSGCRGLEILFKNPTDQEVDRLWHELDPDPACQESHYWRTILISLYADVHQRPYLYIPQKPLTILLNELDPLLCGFLGEFGRVSIKSDHLILSNYLYHESILGRPVPLDEMIVLREAGLV